MIHTSPNRPETKVIAIKFTLRNFVPERQSILQSDLVGNIESIGFVSGLWPTISENGLTMMQGSISLLYIQHQAILALRDTIWDQSYHTIDQFNRACRHRCELVDVQLLVDFGDGNIKLVPTTSPIAAPGF